MYRVFEGERTRVQPEVTRPLEQVIYRSPASAKTVEAKLEGYTVSVVMLALVSIIAVYVILRVQASLPLNANSAPAMTPDLSFNTAVSFATNTNWQNYSGETGTKQPGPGRRALVVQVFHVGSNGPRRGESPWSAAWSDEAPRRSATSGST